MYSLKKSLAEAKKLKVAIAHFNISELVTLKAIWQAAQELSNQVGRKIPVIIGVSEGEREFMDAKKVAVIIRYMRKEHDYPIFINADHTHSLEKCIEAANARYDAILFDGGKLSLAENIAKTKEVVSAVKEISAKILVEGEMGYIGSGSEILKEVPAGAAIKLEDITKPEDAERFVKETGVDLFAPAVGNIHGMFANSPNPHLYIEAVKKIRRLAKRPLVLHGGSGTPNEDFVKAISAGVAIIHISTELRRAWKIGAEKGLREMTNEVAPYKLMMPALEEVKKVALARLKLFNRV